MGNKPEEIVVGLSSLVINLPSLFYDLSSLIFHHMITPIEIRQHAFRKSFRGFDPEEVRGFLNTVSLEWEKVLDDLKQMRTEFEKTKSNLDSLKQVESVLHKTLLQAEQTSRVTVENAKKNADLRLQEAEAKHQMIVQDAMNERSRIEIEINDLINYRNEIFQQLKSFLNSQTERLKNFETREARPGDKLKKEPQQEKSKSFFDAKFAGESGDEMISQIVEELE